MSISWQNEKKCRKTTSAKKWQAVPNAESGYCKHWRGDRQPIPPPGKKASEKYLKIVANKYTLDHDLFPIDNIA